MMMSKNLAVGIDGQPGMTRLSRGGGTFKEDVPEDYNKANRESILSLLEFHENEPLEK